jgi:hypothetical protein
MLIVIDKNNLLNNTKDNLRDVPVLDKITLKKKKNLFKSLKSIIGEGMKEPSYMARDMAMEPFIIAKEGNMLEVGNLIKCMEKVFFITQIIK